jgi:hypothetical protein
MQTARSCGCRNSAEIPDRPKERSRAALIRVKHKSLYGFPKPLAPACRRKGVREIRTTAGSFHEEDPLYLELERN